MEFPLIEKSWKKGMRSIDIVYPNIYSGGLYCLAPLIVYNITNFIDGWSCNRVFLDKGRIKSKFIGFTLQYELDCRNVLDILKKNGIPLDKSCRDEIIFAGGPVVNSNVHVMSKYFDFFIVGEGEEVLVKIMAAYEKYPSKPSFLEKISCLDGVFVPGISNKVRPVFVKDLDSAPYPLYQPLPLTLGKEHVFGNVFMLEIERGCPFMCSFCPMPNFYGHIKHRGIDSIKRIIDDGISLNRRDKVVIYSASFAHPKRKEILEHLLSKGLKFSVPSLKVELVDMELLSLIKRGGQRTLTVAPECNESLRKKICKMIPDKKFLDFAAMAGSLGFGTIKYYFMVGLPDQDDSDLEETVALIKLLKKSFSGKTYVSINPFVPKPGTGLAGHPFDSRKIKSQLSFMHKALKSAGVRVKVSGFKSAILEYTIANAKEYP